MKYLKWLFTRWYLYVMAFVLFINNLANHGTSMIREEPAFTTGLIIGDFIISALLISIIYGTIKLVKRKKK